MKKIEAIIKSFELDKVAEALFSIGVNGITVSEVMGSGKKVRHPKICKGSEYVSELAPRIELFTVVSDEMVELVIETLVRETKTEKVGDRKIFVSNVEEVVEIRTNNHVGQVA